MTRQSTSQTQQQTVTFHPLSSGGILQRKCMSCGQHQFGGGTCAKCSEKGSVELSTTGISNLNQDFSQVPASSGRFPALQPKLTIGQPNDKYEQEADRVAEQVMRMPEPNPMTRRFLEGAKPGALQRACTSCGTTSQEDEAFVQTKLLTGLATPTLQRQEAVPEEEEEETLQMKPLASRITPIVQRQADSSKQDDDDERILQAKPLSQRVSQGLRVGIGDIIQRESVEEEEDREEPVQTKLIRSQVSPLVQRQTEVVEEEDEDREPEILPSVQPKLKIGQPNDQYEQEADQIADRVMRIPEGKPDALNQTIALEPESEKSVQHQSRGGLSPASTPQIVPSLQAACDECKIPPPTREETEEASEEPEEKAQTTSVNPKAEVSATQNRSHSPEDFSASLEKSKQGGKPLAKGIRQMMEHRFGEDFSHVYIHVNDPESTSMNRSIRAKAFTHENHIFFNTGKYNPNTKDGQWLLAHELTHVIQQTGSREVQPRVQRSTQTEPKLGDWAHDHIQEVLRSGDKKIITEAPIPGGTRHEKKINVVGFADLYKATGQVVSGIAAQEPAESKHLLEKHQFYKYVNMRRDWLNRATPTPKNATKGPKINTRKKSWDFNPNFPSNFEIGEIKPLIPTQFQASLAYQGLGIAQAGNYREGFREFVERVYKDNPQYKTELPPTITGRPLQINEKKAIPDAINYKKFEEEYQTLGQNHKLTSNRARRLWIYNKYKNRDGLISYFLLQHPYTSNEFPRAVEAQLQALDPLLAGLRQKRPQISGNLLSPKRENPRSRKKIPSIIRRSISPKIQTRQEDPIQLGREWESDRKSWVRGKTGSIKKPKNFLKNQAKGVEEKAKIDKKLGVKPSSSKLRKQIKDIRKIRFWSSLRGRFLGALRFRFAKVFDKVENLFKTIKEKFRRHHKGSDALNKKEGIFDGWKKIATKAIIRFSVEILKQMLIDAFKRFTSCINGIIEAILSKFTTAINEHNKELISQIEPICCEMLSFKTQLEGEYTKHEKKIASFTKTVEKIKKWEDILDNVETAIRAGVLIVSCGVPPGIGCLWGAVAQLGIGAGLSLLSRTDYFKDEIAKPAASQLMDTIVGDSFNNFLVGILERTPLKAFIGEVSACQRSTKIRRSNRIGGNLHKLDPNNPKNIKARKQWEQDPKIQQAILKDLQDVFEKGKGQKVTAEDLQKMVELIRESSRSPEEIKRMVEAARDPSSGKLKLEKASENIKKGEVPSQKSKKRKIDDYEKVVQNNRILQKTFGWEPKKFYKKPGLKVDSEEFANAVYDMQEALQVKPDGTLGVDTLIAFYDKNKLKKDQVYKDAVRERKKLRSENKSKDGQSTESESKGSGESDIKGGDEVSVESAKAQTDNGWKGDRSNWSTVRQRVTTLDHKAVTTVTKADEEKKFLMHITLQRSVGGVVEQRNANNLIVKLEEVTSSDQEVQGKFRPIGTQTFRYSDGTLGYSEEKHSFLHDFKRKNQ